jgi:thioredoxin-related protein
MFDYLTKNFEVKGTPSFFIMNEDGEIVEQVKLEMEPADVLMFNIKKFQD